MILSFIHTECDELVHRPVVACLLPALYCHGKHISTSGLCSSFCFCFLYQVFLDYLSNFTNVHIALADSGSVQCGFCSPGVAVSIACGKANKVEDIEEILDGNLCRCTGYAPFFKALEESKEFELKIMKIPKIQEEFQYKGKDGRLW